MGFGGGGSSAPAPTVPPPPTPEETARRTYRGSMAEKKPVASSTMLGDTKKQKLGEGGY